MAGGDGGVFAGGQQPAGEGAFAGGGAGGAEELEERASAEDVEVVGVDVVGVTQSFALAAQAGPAVVHASCGVGVKGLGTDGALQGAFPLGMDGDQAGQDGGGRGEPPSGEPLGTQRGGGNGGECESGEEACVAQAGLRALAIRNFGGPARQARGVFGEWFQSPSLPGPRYAKGSLCCLACVPTWI